MKKTKYPSDWDEARVEDNLRHYEEQTEDEAAAEDEAALTVATQTVMAIPNELVPTVSERIAKLRVA